MEQLEGTGKFIVDLRVSPSNKIEVFIDGMKGVSVKDCVDLSRHIESSLDREAEDFELEVSSPGAEEPFRVKEQYSKNAGRKVKVITEDGKEYTGLLCGLEGDKVVLETTEKKAKPVGKGKILVKEKINLGLDKVKQTRVILSFK